jgi:hypothetical protein
MSANGALPRAIAAILLLAGCASPPETQKTPGAPRASAAPGPTSAEAVMASSPPVDANVAALVRTIDDDPDPLHADFTPAVQALVKKGWPGARAVVHLLDAPEHLTRLRAQRVIEGVVKYHHGWRPGVGYADPSGQDKTLAVLAQNGSYRADAPEGERRASMEKWRGYLAAQGG